MSEAKLVWITPNAEQVISHCARVSNPKNQDNPDYAKLLDYCLRNKHFSIFEMASACFEIKCSRTIARQILRHRSFSFQEFSGRYAEMPERPILSKARRQDPKNRQNSTDDAHVDTREYWERAQELAWGVAYREYTAALQMGIAKELARNLLPEGMAQSTMYMSGTIRSWIHYLEVRTGNGTQLEHIEVARQIQDVLKVELPAIFAKVS